MAKYLWLAALIEIMSSTLKAFPSLEDEVPCFEKSITPCEMLEKLSKNLKTIRTQRADNFSQICKPKVSGYGTHLNLSLTVEQQLFLVQTAYSPPLTDIRSMPARPLEFIYSDQEEVEDSIEDLELLAQTSKRTSDFVLRKDPLIKRKRLYK